MSVKQIKNKELVLKNAPFLVSKDTVPRIMWDVVLALMPAAGLAVYFFGIKALFVTITAVISCVFFEYAVLAIRTRSGVNYGSALDGSAVITGLLLAFNLPSTMPLWAVVICSAVSIIIAKQLFGGLGRNIFNPALAGRIFAMHAWPDFMSASWVPPRTQHFAEALSSYATPLRLLKEKSIAKLPPLWDMFIGNHGGCIGETSAIALLIGAAYLLAKKRITFVIPFTYVATVGLLTWIFGGDKPFTGLFLYHMLGGGLILGAFFMATDMVTSPYTPKGQFIYALMMGALTTLIRLKGGYPEGVSYSIFFMNALVPLIDRYTRNCVYGTQKAKKNG